MRLRDISESFLKPGRLFLPGFLFLLFCLPLADKLALRSEQERLNKSIVMEAAIAINRGVSPMVLEESLKIFLSPKERDKSEAGEGKSE